MSSDGWCGVSTGGRDVAGVSLALSPVSPICLLEGCFARSFFLCLVLVWLKNDH